MKFMKKTILIIFLLAAVLVLSYFAFFNKGKQPVVEVPMNAETAQQRAEKKAQLNAEVQKALDENNENACDDIKDEDAKYTCRYNILVNKALQEGDKAFCDKIGLESYVKKCKENLEN